MITNNNQYVKQMFEEIVRLRTRKISNFDLCQKRFPEEVDFSVETKTLSNKIVVPAKSVLVLKF